MASLASLSLQDLATGTGDLPPLDDGLIWQDSVVQPSSFIYCSTLRDPTGHGTIPPSQAGPPPFLCPGMRGAAVAQAAPPGV